MRTFVGILFFYAAFSIVTLDTVVFQDCGSEYHLDDVSIDGCNRQECILKKGKSANIQVKLYGRDVIAKNLKQTVYLLFNGIHVPVPTTPKNLCTTVYCPVHPNSNASFIALMDFATLPNVQSAVVIYWKILNERNEMLMCFKANAKYENPKMTLNHKSNILD